MGAGWHFQNERQIVKTQAWKQRKYITWKKQKTPRIKISSFPSKLDHVTSHRHYSEKNRILLSLLFPLCSQCAGPTSHCSPLLHGTVSLGIDFPRSLSWPCLFSWLRSLSRLLQGRALYSLMHLKSFGWCPVHTRCSINTLKERLQHGYYFPRYFEFCSTPLRFIVWNFRSLWLESSTRVVGNFKVLLCNFMQHNIQYSAA